MWVSSLDQSNAVCMNCSRWRVIDTNMVTKYAQVSSLAVPLTFPHTEYIDKTVILHCLVYPILLIIDFSCSPNPRLVFLCCYCSVSVNKALHKLIETWTTNKLKIYQWGGNIKNRTFSYLYLYVSFTTLERKIFPSFGLLLSVN